MPAEPHGADRATPGSRWNAGRTPELGARVVVRRHLRPGEGSAPLTDVIGHLVGFGAELVVRRESGEEVRVPRAEVAVLKVLPPRPVRARDVREVEFACALGWPGTQQELVDGWLCRAGDDWSYRAGAAVPVEPWASVADLDGVRAWYAGRGLPTRLELVARLLPDATPAWGDGAVAEWGRELMLSTGDCAAIAAIEPERARSVHLDARPDERWLGLYHGTAGLPADRVLPALTASAGLVDGVPRPGGEVVFARLEIGGALAAIARGVVTAGPDGEPRVGIGCVETDPTRRRQGLAEVLTSALAAWGLENGARQAYLHVFADNAAGRGLWTKVGLTPHHSLRHVVLT